MQAGRALPKQRHCKCMRLCVGPLPSCMHAQIRSGRRVLSWQAGLGGGRQAAAVGFTHVGGEEGVALGGVKHGFLPQDFLWGARVCFCCHTRCSSPKEGGRGWSQQRPAYMGQDKARCRSSPALLQSSSLAALVESVATILETGLGRSTAQLRHIVVAIRVGVTVSRAHSYASPGRAPPLLVHSLCVKASPQETTGSTGAHPFCCRPNHAVYSALVMCACSRC